MRRLSRANSINSLGSEASIGTTSTAGPRRLPRLFTGANVGNENHDINKPLPVPSADPKPVAQEEEEDDMDILSSYLETNTRVPTSRGLPTAQEFRLVYSNASATTNLDLTKMSLPAVLHYRTQIDSPERIAALQQPQQQQSQQQSIQSQLQQNGRRSPTQDPAALQKGGVSTAMKSFRRASAFLTSSMPNLAAGSESGSEGGRVSQDAPPAVSNVSASTQSLNSTGSSTSPSTPQLEKKKSSFYKLLDKFA